MSEEAQRKPAAHVGNAITEGVIWKTLLSFFFPILLGTLFQQLYNTVDAIIVGKFVGKEALAAVGGATGALINLIVGFFVGLSSGATVILSQYYGARQKDKVSDAVHTASALALAGGFVIMLLGLFVAPEILKLMGTPADILPFAMTYVRIYFCGVIPSLVYNMGSGLLRAVGDSRRPLLFLVTACTVNIIMDIVLVVGMEMGVAGAAYATIFSQFVSAILVVVTLTKTTASYRLNFRKIRFHGTLLKHIIHIGLPAGVQSVMYSISNVIIQSAINGFGTDAVAGFTAWGKLDAFFWMIINAFGISITTFAGQNFGAGKFARLRKGVSVCLGMCFLGVGTLSVLMLFFGRYLLRMFTDDPVVIDYGIQMMRLLAPAYLTYIFTEIFSGTMRGVGDTLLPTLFTLFGVCLVRVAWVLIVVPKHHELMTLLLSYPLTWSLASLLFIVYYLFGGWLKRAASKTNLAMEGE